MQLFLNKCQELKTEEKIDEFFDALDKAGNDFAPASKCWLKSKGDIARFEDEMEENSNFRSIQRVIEKFARVANYIQLIEFLDNLEKEYTRYKGIFSDALKIAKEDVDDPDALEDRIKQKKNEITEVYVKINQGITDIYKRYTDNINSEGIIMNEATRKQKVYEEELENFRNLSESQINENTFANMKKVTLDAIDDSKTASDIIQGSLYSEIASGIPEVLPPIVFSYKDTCKGDNLPTDKIHNQQLMIPKGFFDGEGQSPLCSLVTSEELCGICTIPVDNTVGFEIKEAKNYSLNYLLQDDDKELGYVCEYDRPLKNMPFGLSDYDLNKHTFVCGITGSGKTNTVKKILESVDKPFMVIEPAKKEYRNIKKEKNIYTLGRPEINCLKINP